MKKLKPRPRTTKMKSPLLGMPGELAAHEHDAAHDCLHPTACGLYQAHSLGLELGMILLARASIPVYLQNILFLQIKGGPGHKDRNLRRQKQLTVLAHGFGDLKNEPDRRLCSFNLSVDTAPVDGLVLFLLRDELFPAVVFGCLQPVLFVLPSQIVLNDEVGIVSLNQILDQFLAVEAAVSHDQKRFFDHRAAVGKALGDKSPGS